MSRQLCFALANPVALASRPRRHWGSSTSISQSRHISLQSSPRSRQLPVALATKEGYAAELEDALLTKIDAIRSKSPDVGLHRLRKKHPALFEEAAAAILALEQSNIGFGKATSRLRKLLPGTWILVLTNSEAVEKNAGSVTGLGSLPGAQCLQVKVELQPDGKARTAEKIKVFGFVDGENALLGNWRIAGRNGRTLEVTYANAVLMGKTTLRADSKAVLETTYCSEKVRVGRGKSGDFYVFIRE